MVDKTRVVMLCHPNTMLYLQEHASKESWNIVRDAVVISTMFPEDDHVAYVLDAEKFVDFINENAEIFTKPSEEDEDDTAGNVAEDQESVKNG